MLPMFVFGLLVNIIAAFIQHKVSNKLLMAIGAFSYLVAFILAAVQRSGNSYWAFSFPALSIVVAGADFQYVVTNVSVFCFIQRCPAENVNRKRVSVFHFNFHQPHYIVRMYA
jgi:nitrate/nitrite transporter NarK